MMIIGSGLLTTLTATTPMSQRVGFLILTGLSFGPGGESPRDSVRHEFSVR